MESEQEKNAVQEKPRAALIKKIMDGVRERQKLRIPISALTKKRFMESEQDRIAVWTKKSAQLDRIQNGIDAQALALNELLKEVLKGRAEIWEERIAK